MTDLDRLAETNEFQSAKQIDRAAQLVWLLCQAPNCESVTIDDLLGAFHSLHLPTPNRTRLSDGLTASKIVRKISKGKFAPVRKFSNEMAVVLPLQVEIPDTVFDVTTIELPPFVKPERQGDLAKMVRVYARLFLLENSMRGLIESVLMTKFGGDWWDHAASASMKRKHEQRLENERSKKWAPARADVGPLYALDWPDLITIMRKFHEEFEPHIKEIDFLHRYDDAGTFRNVVAHNGVIRDADDFELIRIYYGNWIKQLS
jgi:hypothetical protein